METPDIRYIKLFEQSPNGILLLEDDRITYTNPAFCSLIGLTEDAVVGREFKDFLHPDDRAQATRRMRRGLEGVLPRGGHEYRVLHADGSVIPVDIELNLLEIKGTSTLLLFVRDGRQRKALEEQLRQIQKMEAIGHLAAGVAHDFNNLLGGMANYLTLLRSLIPEGSRAKVYADEIQGLIERGTALIGQILAVSRPPGGKKSPHDLKEVMDPVIRMLKHSLPKGIDLQIEYGDLPPFRMDPSGIQQLIMNLCINAVDAMPEGGELKVRTSRARLSKDMAENLPGVETGPYAHITVADTGIGMDEDARQRIFEPFFTTKGKGARSGLGLTICYNIVKDHEGIIDVKSIKGKGTIFSIYLPLVEGEPEEISRPESRVLRGDETILIVEDEKTMLESTALLLEGLGYKTVKAGGGREAVEIYKKAQGSIDLVLIDLGMPEMDGQETFMALKHLDPKVRALVLTGLPLSDEVQQVMKRGALGIIQKPFMLGDLSRKIRDVLDRSDSEILQHEQEFCSPSF